MVSDSALGSGLVCGLVEGKFVGLTVILCCNSTFAFQGTRCIVAFIFIAIVTGSYFWDCGQRFNWYGNERIVCPNLSVR